MVATLNVEHISDIYRRLQLIIIGCSELRHTRHIPILVEQVVFSAGDIPMAEHMGSGLAQVHA